MTTRDKGITLQAQFSYTDVSTTGLRTTDVASDYTSKYAWKYGAASQSPVNLSPLTAVAPTDFTVRGQDATAVFAATGGNLLLTPGIGTGGNASGNVQIKDSAGTGGTWSSSHLMLGGYHLWVDATNRLRIKSSVPTSDTDGNVVGLDLIGSAVYDPPNLVDGAGTTTTVAVAGAALGDFALASFSLDLQGITVTAYISAANTVSVRFQNESGGPLDLASGTLRVKVIKA